MNIDAASYNALWRTTLSIHLGGAALALDLRHWVNSGLMTFFFFVIGLEARREFDVGELRERSRATLPLVAGIGGMIVPVLIYLAFNAGRGSERGWGAAMSTDTAFALGMLALVGARRLDRLRAFLLTVVVIDDIVALLVIALAYTEHLALGALLVALGLFAAVLLALALHVHRGIVYAALGLAVWVALLESGVEPVVVGLAMGLLTYAYPAARSDLEAASERFRSFREQPTPELARSARAGVQSAISPNDRLQQLYHPWTSYVIVPLFALANAGIVVSDEFLRRAFASSITLGIMIGYVVGKPVGVVGASWLVTALSRGRLRPLVGWASVVGGGTIAGIGFTVSLLIAALAFDGSQLEEAKLGVLAGALIAAAVTWVVFRTTALLPPRSRIRALLGTSDTIVDLAASVDAGARPHPRTPRRARDVGRIWGLRVPVLRHGGAAHPRTARRPRRRALRLASPALERRASARATCRGGLRGGRGAGRLLADARHPAAPSARPAHVGPDPLRRGDRSRRRPVRARSAAARGLVAHR